jgi:hypothetical protein
MRGVFAALGLVSAACSQAALAAQPDLWMYPCPFENGEALHEIFENPGAWARARSQLTGIGYADHWLNSQFSDAQLRAWLPQIARWGLKFGLDVGSVKPGSPTAEKAFAVSHPRWDRFIKDGLHIDEMDMDEPLVATVVSLHLPVSYGVEQTAQFVAMVRRAYPPMQIGDTEPYPYFNPGQIMGFIDAVQARLRQLGVRPLDFLRLDVDWTHFYPPDAKGALAWRGVKQIEILAHQRGLRFSLIYWAANYPALSKAGQARPDTWTSAILREAADYARVGGVPDEYPLMSWLLTQQEPVPTHVIPDSSPITLSGSVLALDAQLKR